MGNICGLESLGRLWPRGRGASPHAVFTICAGGAPYITYADICFAGAFTLVAREEPASSVSSSILAALRIRGGEYVRMDIYLPVFLSRRA